MVFIFSQLFTIVDLLSLFLHSWIQYFVVYLHRFIAFFAYFINLLFTCSSQVFFERFIWLHICFPLHFLGFFAHISLQVHYSFFFWFIFLCISLYKEESTSYTCFIRGVLSSLSQLSNSRREIWPLQSLRWDDLTGFFHNNATFKKTGRFSKPCKIVFCLFPAQFWRF